jgi:hypothetical protein
MVRAVCEIKFPGYGLGVIGETAQPDGSNGSYTLVDDFVGPDLPDFRKVRLESGTLIYTSATGEQSLTRSIAKAQ